MRAVTHLLEQYCCGASAPSQSSNPRYCPPQPRHSTSAAVFFSRPSPSSAITTTWPYFKSTRRRRTPLPALITTSTTTNPARDRVIDFGKHKGKMLGTLPSTYLKWVSKNLRAGDFEEWAKLADEVLTDPIYRDRIEWEFTQKLLNGDVLIGSGAVAELLEISERFGWDNDDKAGWSRIDFGLLGTSKGGRIPRKRIGNITTHVNLPSPNNYKHGVGRLQEKKDSRLKEINTVNSNDSGETQTTKRRERRERVRLKREGTGTTTTTNSVAGSKNSSWVDDQMMTAARNQEADHYPTVEINPGPFPGRASLLNKALKYRKKLSY